MGIGRQIISQVELWKIVISILNRLFLDVRMNRLLQSSRKIIKRSPDSNLFYLVETMILSVVMLQPLLI